MNTSDRILRSASKPKTNSTSNPVRPGGAGTWLRRGCQGIVPLKKFTPSNLKESKTTVSSVDGFELLCTYNWTALPKPTIYVPGAPPTWRPLELPFTLKRDSGIQFIDQNSYRSPAYPFEPVFKALSVTDPDVDFSCIDVIINRNSLKYLLKFAQGSVDEEYRLILKLVDNTLFVTRSAKNDSRWIHPGQDAGYGHSFEDACTEHKNVLEKSSGHHRIIRYKLGHLDCAVRFEADACFDSNDELQSKDPTSRTTSSIENAKDVPSSNLNKGDRSNAVDESMLASLTGLSLDSLKEKESGTRVIRAGHIVACSTVAEVKTKKRKATKFSSIAHRLPQLWFGRTITLFVAEHDSGIFEKIDRIDAGVMFPDWETKNQGALRKLVQLIDDLRETVRGFGDRTYVAVCDYKTKPLALEVFAATKNKEVLPKQFIQKFWKENAQEMKFWHDMRSETLASILK